MLEMIWFWITAAFSFAFLFVIAIFVILFFLLIFVYNEVHYSKYKKLMAHLEKHHYDIYEEIRIKPIIGPFYLKGVYRKSMMYAKNHPPIDDPIAEELFAEYAKVSQLGFKVFIDIIADIFNGRLDLGYNKQDMRAGAIAGIIVGSISGVFIGSLEIPFFPFSFFVPLGPFWGAIIGALGGVAAGVYSSVREFGWEMTPLSRAIFGAVFGAFSWVMALSMLRSMLQIFLYNL